MFWFFYSSRLFSQYSRQNKKVKHFSRQKSNLSTFQILWDPCETISQIPQCTCSISHNAPFRTEMYTFLLWMVHYGIWNRCIVGYIFLFWMVYCGIWNWCIVGFVRLVYCGWRILSIHRIPHDEYRVPQLPSMMVWYWKLGQFIPTYKPNPHIHCCRQTNPEAADDLIFHKPAPPTSFITIC